MVDADKKQNKGIRSEKMVRPMKISTRPDVTDLIGQRLRKFYDEVTEQPVPDRFLHLLDQLDEAASSKKSK
ncbi:MAG TPA: NepR family anti-sigma factor [Aestuariivirga sp.]|jgi:hypothetical protein